MLQLTPSHVVNVQYVTQVMLFHDGLDMVCRVWFEDGQAWEIRGEYAEVAWTGWSAYWKGRRHDQFNVRVPSSIIQKLKRI